MSAPARARSGQLWNVGMSAEREALRAGPAPTPPRKAHFALQTTEPTTFGHGWISGLLSALLGILGFGAVLCLHFPDLLTMPELRPYYSLPAIRAALHVVLVTSFLLGVVSVCLRRNKALGTIGMGATLLAALLGGSQVPVTAAPGDGPFLGLDWFLVNLILYSAIYVPLERLFAKHPEQPTFRPQWRVDLTYFFLNSLLVQVMTLLTLKPAMLFFDWARVAAVYETISGLPLLVQVPLVLLIADLAQYWVHRAFHSVPALWRFHAVHHSAEAMDWLAGSRLHLIDAIVTRAITYVPIYVLGFSEVALYVYVVIVVVQATFIHANVRWELPHVRRVLATPWFHHWHHAAEPQAVDKNFCVHTPLWDWLFGTLHAPPRWPKAYGLHGRSELPGSWTGQLLYPFRRRRRANR
jgi:sterol desaturase/sphingolipid hydroxylase (fatty acid hydroxylase superfamily)